MKVNILGRTVDVVPDKTLPDRGRRGECYLELNKIHIDPELLQEKWNETVLHESIEFTDKLCELELNHQAITILGAALAGVVESLVASTLDKLNNLNNLNSKV